ncbi:MAG: peroxiredoxin [Cyclobacteriaceae bacterium]
MALKKGDKAPAFKLKDDEGKDFDFPKQSKGKPCIIYFYPKNFTAACTAEACEFRDQFSIFRDLDIDVYGISTDSVESHKKFKEANQLPFKLLSDTKGRVAALYKAKVPFLPMTRRVSFLIDANQKIVDVYENLFDGARHIKAMVDAVKKIS